MQFPELVLAMDLGVPGKKNTSEDIWDFDWVGQMVEGRAEGSGQGVEASCAVSIWEVDLSLDSLLCFFLSAEFQNLGSQGVGLEKTKPLSKVGVGKHDIKFYIKFYKDQKTKIGNL